MQKELITVPQIRKLLLQENLLKEIITPTDWVYTVPQEMTDIAFTSLSYDSRTANAATLFSVKGLLLKKATWPPPLIKAFSATFQKHLMTTSQPTGSLLRTFEKRWQ